MTATADNENVVRYLQAAANEAPDRPALIIDGPEPGTLTFGQLWDRVDRISAGLRRASLAPNDRAICMIPMSLDLYATLLGLLKMGGVGVFVDPWIGRDAIGAFSAFAAPRAWLGIAKSHLLRYLDGRLRRIPVAVTTGRRVGPWPAPISLRDLEAATGDQGLEAVAADASGLITFTSGSSGVPKGANRTHAFLSAQHEALRAEFPYHDDDVDMPMFPVFALNNLARGIASVIPDMDFRNVAGVDGDGILAQMRRHAVTTCTASPPFFDRVVEHLASQPERRPALRRILTGGAPVSDAQLRAWQAQLPDTEIIVVYGSTEAEPVAHIEAGERLRAATETTVPCPGFCVGRPTDRLATRVVRIHHGPIELGGGSLNDWEVVNGEVGELVVSGAHVCRDYFNNPAAVGENKIVEADGRVWHRMGDTGYFDDSGRFWLVGRVHSTIVRNGVAVHPQQVEQLVADLSVEQVAAVGMADAALGERVTLVVIAAADGVDEAAIHERAATAGIAIDEIVVSRESLPVDPRHNSKIDYTALRARLARD